MAPQLNRKRESSFISPFIEQRPSARESSKRLDPSLNAPRESAPKPLNGDLSGGNGSKGLPAHNVIDAPF
jgi:hypothetical protein